MSSARRCGTPSWVADPSDAGPTPAHLRVVGVTSETVLVASADLRVVVVGMPASGPLRRRVAGLVPTLTHSGHHVVEQPWRDLLRGAQPAEAADLILLVEGGPATVAGQLTATRWARRPLGAQPPVVLLAVDRGVDSRCGVGSSPLSTSCSAPAPPQPQGGARSAGDSAGRAPAVRAGARSDVLTADEARFVATLETIAARGVVTVSRPRPAF